MDLPVRTLYRRLLFAGAMPGDPRMCEDMNFSYLVRP